MENVIFLKLGGSLITDKQRRYHARADTIRRLGQEIARAREADPGLQILLGHGSGSFGHVAAQDSGYDPERGHASPVAFAQVGAAASALNNLVRAAMLESGVPAFSLPPSASARLEGEQVVEMAVRPIIDLLKQGIVPLIFGDVALRMDGGSGIASTEAVFRYLAPRLRPQRLLLLGITDGVCEQAPTEEQPHPPLIPEITPANWEEVRAGLTTSHGTDVTGGMVSKVMEILELVRTAPWLQARILNGDEPGLLERLLLDPDQVAGTLIHGGKQ